MKALGKSPYYIQPIRVRFARELGENEGAKRYKSRNNGALYSIPNNKSNQIE